MQDNRELSIEELEAILSDEPETPYIPNETYVLRNGDVIEDLDQANLMYRIMKIDPLNDKLNYQLNDKGFANVCADILRPTVAFCSDNMKFYYYDGIKWCLDKGTLKVSSILKTLLMFLGTFYPKEKNLEEEEATEYFKYLSKYDSKRQRDQIIKDLQDELAINIDEFDKNPYLINLTNVTFDLSTMTYHEHNPKDMLSKVTNCYYPLSEMQQEKCVRFYDFFEQIMNGDKEKAKFLHEALGYSLLGLNPKECMLIAFGKTTRNGKSTLFDTISDILGDYGVNVNSRFLNKTLSKNDTDKPSPTIVSLKGKRFINMQESDKHAEFDGALIKQITGNDEMQGRNLHEGISSFRVSGKMWYSCNHLPYCDDETLFSSDRVAVIEFDKHFNDDERDETLKQTFLLEENKASIFYFLVEGYQIYKENNLKRPAVIIQATNAYRMRCNSVLKFIIKNFNITHDYKQRVERKVLYEKYVAWCGTEDLIPVKKQRFNDEIEAQNLQIMKSNGTRYVTGLQEVLNK